MPEVIEKVIEINPADLALHMASLRQTMGWQIILRYWAEEREKIITEGKKARSFEKTCNLFKVIEGFDRCAEMAEKLENYGKQNTQESEYTEEP